MKNVSLLSFNQKKVLILFEDNTMVTVAKVVSVLKLPRPTAKQVLGRLESLRLIEQAGAGRASYYTLKKKDAILDQFGNEVVEVYKGISGFRKLFDQISKKLKSKDFYWAFAFKNEYASEEVRSLLLSFHQKLAEKKVDDRAIAHISQKGLLSKIYKNVKNLKLKFVELDLPVGVIIIDGAVIQLVWGNNPMAFMVINPVVYNQYKDFFSQMWQSS